MARWRMWFRRATWADCLTSDCVLGIASKLMITLASTDTALFRRTSLTVLDRWACSVGVALPGLKFPLACGCFGGAMIVQNVLMSLTMSPLLDALL